MNNIPEAKAGDIIICQGIRAEIAEIAYQECYPLDDKGNYEWFMEFTDTKGVYRSWKSELDGGRIILKDHRYAIKIYQAPVWKPFCFRNWKYAQEYSKDKLEDHYRCVYKDTIDTNDLNKIWIIFNINHPEDYKARSLSVSDIVILSDTSGSEEEERYFVDSFGFHKLTNDEFAMRQGK